MKIKVNKMREFDEQIKDIEKRTKIIIKELEHIKQANHMLISYINKMLDTPKSV